MTEQIIVVILIILAWLKSEWNVWKIRRNDLGGLMKKDDFSKFIAKYNREMGQLQADIKNMKADISSIETRFNKHINEK